jgi:crossover junction endodeoxyribonuclease RuvC
MKILGIDPSLSCTGWCIITIGEVNNGIEWGYIKTDPSQSTSKRIKYINNQIIDMMVKNTFDYVGIESESMNSRSSSMVQLWELTGVLKNSCYSMRTTVLMFPPLMARSIVLGTTQTPKKGSSKKSIKEYCDWMKSKLLKAYPEDITDVYDAYVVAESARIELIGSKTNFKLAQMRLCDEKILTKSRKKLYSYGIGKKKVQFKDLSKVDEPTFSELMRKYREIIGQDT